MDKRVRRNAKVLLERCESGRIGLTANELTWVTGSEGSNPSLSARGAGCVVPGSPRRRPAPAGSPCTVARAGPAWCEECVESWAAIGCRPWGVPRIRWTPTSSRGTSRRRATRRRPPPVRPIWSWSTPVRSSTRLARSRSRPSLSWPSTSGAGARLVVTGCMAERYGDELRDALPEVDLVAGFGRDFLAPLDAAPAPTPSVPVTLAGVRRLAPVHDFDLLSLARPAARAPWAYVKVAEGCDRICGFCAIPSFRGKQRSRTPDEILAEVDSLCSGADHAGVPPLREVVLVAQDLASYGRDRSEPGRRAGLAGTSPIAELTRRRGGPGGAHPPPLSLPVGPDRYPGGGRPRDGRALLRPLAPARGAPASGAHAPVGRRRAVPAPHRGHPGRRAARHLPLLVHLGLSR